MRHSRLALAVVALFIVAGCTQTLGSHQPPSPTAHGSSSTTPESSTDPAHGADALDYFVTDVATAVAKAKSYHMEIVSASEDTKMSWSSDVASQDPADPTLAMTVRLDSGDLTNEVELRIVKGEVFMRSGPGSKVFYKGNPDDPKDPTYSLMKSIAEQGDPLDSMLQTKESIVSVEDRGRSTADGATVRVLDVTVDTSKALETEPATSSAMPKELVYRYYIGDDDLPVGVEATYGTPVVHMSMQFTRWGDSIVVDAPDPSLVSTDPSVLRSRTGAGLAGPQGTV